MEESDQKLYFTSRNLHSKFEIPGWGLFEKAGLSQDGRRGALPCISDKEQIYVTLRQRRRCCRD